MRPFSVHAFSRSASSCVRENSALEPDAEGHAGKGRGAVTKKSLRIDIGGDPYGATPGRCHIEQRAESLGELWGLPGELLLFRFEFPQRLGAAHTHCLLMTFETLNNPAAAGLDAFA